MHVLVELTGAKKRLNRARRHVEQYSVVKAFIDGQERVYYTVVFIASRSSPCFIQRTRRGAVCRPISSKGFARDLFAGASFRSAGPVKWLMAWHFYFFRVQCGFYIHILSTSHVLSIYPRINTRGASRNRRKHGVQLLDRVFSPILLFFPPWALLTNYDSKIDRQPEMSGCCYFEPRFGAVCRRDQS